jgi:hypothetical protein
VPLVAEELVARRFKHGIRENYPEASEAFLDFARTYWTLRVLVLALLQTHSDDTSLNLGERLLCQLEQEIGPVFFPFPGPEKIDSATREAFQRQLIEESGANIDIEDFMAGNPILLRDRDEEQSKLHGESSKGTRRPNASRRKVWSIPLISSLFGYQGVIKTQIRMYKALKQRNPKTPENELLNELIASRKRAWPRTGPKEQEQANYAGLLQSQNKTLEDVIWAIVDYEFILSRATEARIKGQQLGLTTDEISRAWHDFEASVRADISEALEKEGI